MFSGLISETDEETQHKFNVKKLNKNIKTTFINSENPNKPQNKINSNTNTNKDSNAAYKNRNSFINNYFTEKKVVTINLTETPINNYSESIKNKNTNNYETYNHLSNSNTNKNKKRTKLNSNLTERIPSIDLGNPLKANFNKLLSDAKNDKKKLNFNAIMQNKFTANSNINKGVSNKKITSELKEISLSENKIKENNLNFNHKESIREKEKFETYIESNLKPYVEKTNIQNYNNENKKKENHILEKNKLQQQALETLNNYNSHYPNNNLGSAAVQSININNIHIKNFNVNADSNICELLNLAKYRKIKNDENENNFNNYMNPLNNQVYLQTEVDYKQNDNEKKIISKPYIQVRKFSEKNLIEKEAAKSGLDNNNNNSFKNNHLNQNLQENLLKIKKNIINRGHIKTNSAFEFDVNKLNLQNLINQNFNLKNKLNNEFTKAENTNLNNNNNKPNINLIKSKEDKENKNYSNFASNLTNSRKRNQSYFNFSSSNQKLNNFPLNLHKKAVHSVNFEEIIKTNNFKSNLVTPPLTTKNMGYSSNIIFENDVVNNLRNMFKNTNSEFNFNEKPHKENKDENSNLLIKSRFPKSTKNKTNKETSAKFNMKSINKANYKNLIKEFREGLKRKHSNSLSNLHDFLKSNAVKFDAANKKKACKLNKNSNKNSAKTNKSNSNNFNSNEKNVIIENIDMELDFDVAAKQENLAKDLFENHKNNYKAKSNNKSLSFGDLSTLFNNKKLNSANTMKFNFSPQTKNSQKTNEQTSNKNSNIAVDSLKSNASLGSQKSLLDNEGKYSSANEALSNFNHNILKSTLKDFKNKQTGLKKDLYEMIKNGYKNLFSNSNNNNINNNNNEKNKNSVLSYKAKEKETNRQINTTRNNFDMKIEFGEKNLKNIFQASQTQNLFSETTKNSVCFNSNLGIPKQILYSHKNKDLINSKNFNHSSSNLLNKHIPSGEKNTDDKINFSKTGNNFFSSNKNNFNNLKINTNLNTKNSEFSMSNNNFYNFKNSAYLTNRNDKVKLFELLFDKENEKLKVYEGPIDLNFISFTEPKSLIAEFISVLNAKKITFVKTTPFKLRCTKNGLGFNIEIFKLDEESALFYAKIKQLQGEKEHFRKILRHFILKEN